MIILVTEKEGGHWKPIEISYPGGEEVFAVCLPDGTIWDKMIGIDGVTKMSKEDMEDNYKDWEFILIDSDIQKKLNNWRHTYLIRILGITNLNDITRVLIARKEISNG